MRRNIASSVLVPTLLVAALVVGGASLEGQAAKALLFAASGAVAMTMFAFTDIRWLTGSVRTCLVFLAALTLLVMVQALPAPTWWSLSQTDRDIARSGLSLLSDRVISPAISLFPEATIAAGLAFLAPLAAFALIAGLSWRRGAALMAWTIALLGAASALLGLAQVFTGDQSPLYLYDFTSRGLPAGFFSNVNHQASFLLMCLPFTAALAGRLRRDWEGQDTDTALAILVAACFLLIVVGILGAGSVAGYILLVPVTLLSLFLLGSGRRAGSGGVLGYVMIPAIILFAGAIIFSSPVLEGLGVTSFDDSDLSRVGITRTSLEILPEHWRLGTGLGTFEQVYHLYEDPGSVNRTYVAHAHNDYIEWAIETGVPGMTLLALFLAWWAAQMVRVWTGRIEGSSGLRRAASIATLVIVLHSLVDYPLRTPAIATLGAVCLALMVVPRERPRKKPEPAQDAEPSTRTVTL
jgi:O-antigen ligase